MTPDQRALVLPLIEVPGRGVLPVEQFLDSFGATDGEGLGLALLRDAVARRDPVDVELALVVCFRSGLSAAHLDALTTLAFADWHQRHEDVATALGRLQSPASVEALVHLATWVPDYLQWDDARALATKPVWALGSISGQGAREALESLAGSDDPIVAGGARAAAGEVDPRSSAGADERAQLAAKGVGEFSWVRLDRLAVAPRVSWTSGITSVLWTVQRFK